MCYSFPPQRPRRHSVLLPIATLLVVELVALSSQPWDARDVLQPGTQRTRSEERRIVNDKQPRGLLAFGSVRNHELGVKLRRVYRKLNIRRPQCVLKDCSSVLEEHHCLSGPRRGASKFTTNVSCHVILSSQAGFQFINDDLQKELKPQRYERARKYAAISHLVYVPSTVGLRLASVRQPKDRLDPWDGILLNVFTSDRVGEYSWRIHRVNWW
ncbi:hypothetical protein EDD15DRAFT_687 [Pisolithus albus]|nr:hypothetical protein EDD15DRAFT_687 [Pisolithus albus]